MRDEQRSSSQSVTGSIIEGNLTQIDHANYVMVGVEQVAASGYVEQVRQIAPPELNDRDQELNELAWFCLRREGPSYIWLRAPAWAGKSALISWFALHPPPNVTVISFFITARWQGQNDQSAFIDAVLEQLASLLGEPIPSFLTPATRGPHFLRMLARASELSRKLGKHLILAVDGLDEDRGVTTGPDAYSIAALLPVRPPDGLRIIVSGRPNPPIPSDVPDNHPLRDPSIVRPLIASPLAAVVKSDMQRELKRLLQGTKPERDLLGVVTAAGGGLTTSDLAYLTGLSTYEVEENLHAVSGRTFSGRTGSRQGGPAATVYVLGHEELHSAAAARFGPDTLNHYRERLHSWADYYRQLDWPPQTPEYLLAGYFRMLQSSENLPQMIACTTDRERHDRMLDATGGDIAALTEIASTQDQIVAQQGPDLVALARLTVHRSRLLDRNAHLPTSLPVTWALIGNFDRAEVLAQSITDPAQKTQALAALAMVMAKGENARRAAVLARSIADPGPQIEALFNVAKLVAETGDADDAEAVTLLISDPGPRAMALSNLVAILEENGYHDQAIALSYRAETAARSITGGDWHGRALADFAGVLTQIGEVERAEKVVLSITDLYRREQANANISIILARTGDIDKAIIFARSIFSQNRKEQALADIAHILARAGDVERSIMLVQSVNRQEHREQILANLAVVLAQAGDSQRAVDLARLNTKSYQETEVLAGLAQVMAQAGDIDWAIALVQSMPDPSRQDWSLADITLIVAKAGDIERAMRLIRSVNDPVRKNEALINLVQIAASAGRIGRANAFAKAITNPAQRWKAQAELSRLIGQSGDIDQAAVLAKSIEDSFSRDEALLELALVASRLGENGRAEAIARLITSPPTWRARALAQLAPVMAQSGEIGRAVALVQSITNQDWQDQALGELVPVVAQEASVGHAEILARSIRDPARQERALTELASRFGKINTVAAIARPMQRNNREEMAMAKLALEAAQSGDTDRATTLAYRAEVAARSISDPNWHARALAKLANAAAQLGETGRAVVLAQAIVDPYRRDKALAAVALLAAEAGDHDRADELVQSIRDLSRRGEALADLALLAAQAGDHNRADQLARAIDDPGWLEKAQTDLALLAAEAGDHDRADELVQSIDDPSRREEALADLALLAAQAGDHRRADQLAETIGDQARRERALAELDYAAARPKKIVRPINLRHAATNSEWDPSTRANLERAMAEGADAKIIAELIERAETAARSITDPYRQAQAFADIALLLHKAVSVCSTGVSEGQASILNEEISNLSNQTISIRARSLFANALAVGPWEATIDVLGEISSSAVIEICDEFLAKVVAP